MGGPDAEPADDVRWWRLIVTATPGVVVLAETPDWDSRALYRTLKDVAEQAVADTYLRLSRRFVEAFPCFDVYRSRTRRVLPVIVLRPAPPEGGRGVRGG